MAKFEGVRARRCARNAPEWSGPQRSLPALAPVRQENLHTLRSRAAKVPLLVSGRERFLGRAFGLLLRRNLFHALHASRRKHG